GSPEASGLEVPQNPNRNIRVFCFSILFCFFTAKNAKVYAKVRKVLKLNFANLCIFFESLRLKTSSNFLLFQKKSFRLILCNSS
uniref:hypothetical protein n=1 Tax=Flavobacterium sp. Root935 TaxID=1736610 RepID=UPI0019D6C8C5